MSVDSGTQLILNSSVDLDRDITMTSDTAIIIAKEQDHPHTEPHFGSADLVRDIVIGLSDGLTVPFALAAGLASLQRYFYSFVSDFDSVLNW